MDILQASTILVDGLKKDQYLDDISKSSGVFNINQDALELIHVATMKLLTKKIANDYCPVGFEVRNVQYFQKYGNEYCSIILITKQEPVYIAPVVGKTNYEKYFGTVEAASETLEKILFKTLNICDNFCSFGKNKNVDCVNDLAADDFDCLFAIKQFLNEKVSE